MGVVSVSISRSRSRGMMVRCLTTLLVCSLLMEAKNAETAEVFKVNIPGIQISGTKTLNPFHVANGAETDPDDNRYVDETPDDSHDDFSTEAYYPDGHFEPEIGILGH